MKITKPWAAKGVALYPPSFCMVGQNQVFNALQQFRRSFWDGAGQDIAGFFVVFGDWGLGKTRLGYELIAEATGQIDQWLLNPHEYIIAPYHRSDSKPRVLEPALQDGILPLYIRYSTVCDENLDASIWVPRLAVEALTQMVEASPTAGAPAELYADLNSRLHAKGVDLPTLRAVLSEKTQNHDDRLVRALEVLKKSNLNHIWVIVDEVETPADLKKGLREDTPTKVDDEFLLMVAEVIKHENWRSRHPYVNFLLLCSQGMRDQVQIGPNLRRASSVTLEPNQVTDVGKFVNHLRGSLPDPSAVDYPQGTLEGAFLVANRNFGWFNILMASIHETYARHQERGESVEAWQLLRDFAKTAASANHIFDTNVLPLIGTIEGVSPNDIERLIYGQLPIIVGGASPGSIAPPVAEALLKHEIPDRGHAFAELAQIHIDERGLADELTNPEIGFKAKEGKTDTYFSPNCEISVVGLLEALRAFSMSIDKSEGGAAGDFVIYTDIEQWSEQLAALYPRESIEFAAEVLHRIFMKSAFRVAGARFVGLSFRLWREFDKLLVAAPETIRFFKDGRHEPVLEQYVQGASENKKKRQTAICLGLANLLDEHLNDTHHSPALKEIPHKIFSSEFRSPSLEGLRVTPNGQVTIVYCGDVDHTIDRLKAFIATERVHPILVLMPATADMPAFEERLFSLPLLKRCVMIRRLIIQEEEFLLKYSGRNQAFDPRVAHLSNIANGLLKSYQDEWQSKAREWTNALRKSGHLLAPIWGKKTVPGSADFAKGYRYMLAQNCSYDAAHKDHSGPLGDVEFESCRQAAKKNIEPPAAWKYGDLLGVLTTDGTNKPRVPRCFFSLLQELRTRSSAAKLASSFFFMVPETEIKAVHQMEQVLELLIGIGAVKKTGDLYWAVDKQLLDSRRQSVSNWLKNQCKTMITELKDLFPNQALVLANSDYPTAGAKLGEAENKIRSLDLSILTSSDPDSLTEDMFQRLVRDIDEIESLILGVCPLDIGEQSHQPFDCSATQILSYENRFPLLSLWEKISFLDWLKKNFLKERNGLILEIDKLLMEAASLEKTEGEPFPIAPVTLPLKAIKSELENVAGPTGPGTTTRRATIPVGDYNLLIDQYLVGSKYDSAWKRLEALRGLVNNELPGSFFSRFIILHKQWEETVRDFNLAETAWNDLSAFLSDAPVNVWEKLSQVKANMKKFAGLVHGGLKQQIQSQCEDEPVDNLMEILKTEVTAATAQIKPLEQIIINHHEEILKGLRTIILKAQLQALNRVRRSRNLPANEEPNIAATYGKTKLAFESFNGEVVNEGQGFFEHAGKKTHWGLWVEICAGLEGGTYDEEKHPDHRESIIELNEMKLIRSRLELR